MKGSCRLQNLRITWVLPVWLFLFICVHTWGMRSSEIRLRFLWWHIKCTYYFCVTVVQYMFFFNLSPRERPKMTSNLLWRVIWSEAINIGLALFLVNWSLLSVRFMDQIYSNVAWFNQVCYTYSPIHYEYWPYKGLHIFSFKLRIDSYLPISFCLLG